MRSLYSLLVLVLLGAGCAAPPTARDLAREIEAIERQRFAAMTRQDVAELAPLLASDLVYCHSDGLCESREQFLETIASGRIRYLALQPEALQTRIVGDVAVVNGTLAMEGELGGQRRSLRIVFTDVYARRGGEWQLVAWQSTRVP